MTMNPKKKKKTDGRGTKSKTGRGGDKRGSGGGGGDQSRGEGVSRGVSTRPYATPPHLEGEGAGAGTRARPRPRVTIHHTKDGRIVSVIMTTAVIARAGSTGAGSNTPGPGSAAPPAGVLPPLAGDYGMVGRDATIEVTDIELPDDMRGLDPFEIHERYQVAVDPGAGRSKKGATMKKGSKQAPANAPTLIPIEEGRGPKSKSKIKTKTRKK